MNRLIKALSSSWLLRACSSSIGKKLVMAITGLSLCGFLVVHLAGNMLLYVGADDYNHYAHALHSQKLLLPVAELGLLLIFVWHIILAVGTTRENKGARPVDYAVRQTKQDQGPLASPASSVMYGTGIVVLLFLILHLGDFKFGLWHQDLIQGLEPFDKAKGILQGSLSAAVYLVGSVALGYHVLHGFQSAFQTLGFNHPKYTPLIKLLSLAFAVIVAVGFGSFPLWAWAIKS